MVGFIVSGRWRIVSRILLHLCCREISESADCEVVFQFMLNTCSERLAVVITQTVDIEFCFGIFVELDPSTDTEIPVRMCVLYTWSIGVCIGPHEIQEWRPLVL